MILIIDDNKYRRERLCKQLSFESIYANACEHSYKNVYTKPILTIVYLPKEEDFNKLTNVESKYYYCVRNLPRRKIDETRLIMSSDGEICADDIKNILLKDFNITLDVDDIGPITLDFPKKDIYIGGACIHLNKKQFMICSFLVINYGRKFTLDEIYDYLRFNNRLGIRSFHDYISNINVKCQKVNRDKLIVNDKEIYSISDKYVKGIKRVKELNKERLSEKR